MSKTTTQKYFREPHDYLRAELSVRNTRNPQYSLRAYARDLKVGPSTLSEVLAGRYGFSREKALKVGERLHLDPEAKEDFADLFVAKFSRSSTKKQEALLRIQKRRVSSAGTVTVDAFRAISDWYHMAILELVTLPSFKSEIPWVAKKLGISSLVCEEAINRLLRLNLLRKNDSGKWECTEDFTAIGNNTPSEAIRRFHKQILEKALQALEYQDIESRENSSTIFSIKRSSLPQARADLKKFRQEFASKYTAESPSDSVYCLSIQLFDLLNGDSLS